MSDFTSELNRLSKLCEMDCRTFEQDVLLPHIYPEWVSKEQLAGLKACTANRIAIEKEYKAIRQRITDSTNRTYFNTNPPSLSDEMELLNWVKSEMEKIRAAVQSAIEQFIGVCKDILPTIEKLSENYNRTYNKAIDISAQAFMPFLGSDATTSVKNSSVSLRSSAKLREVEHLLMTIKSKIKQYK